MTLQVAAYSAEDAESWDRFVAAALQGTFLHSRKFLSYHGDRFVDRSALLLDDGQIAGVFAAAEDPNDDSVVVSHPGLSYGAVLHTGGLRGDHMVEALDLLKAHYRALGYARLVYKAVPRIYQASPADDDLYALFRHGAHKYRVDLSTSIQLSNPGQRSSRRKRGLKKAAKSGLHVSEGSNLLGGFWKILAENLASKHAASPVHSVEEIELLASWFPNNIRCVCALQDQEALAGVVLFDTATCTHAQYIAANDAGRQASALDLVFDHCIEQAKQSGKTWFDFGISTESGGAALNANLYRFKTEFGGGGVTHDFYRLELDN